MHYDYIIIGGGVMGLATAYSLGKKGKQVLVLEQYNLKHYKQASSDVSRAFRYEYGKDIFYTTLAEKTLPLWKTLEQESKQQLLSPCGALLLSDNSDETAYAMQSYTTLREHQYPVELLDKKQLEQRFPQLTSTLGVLDPHGAILRAEKTLDAYITLCAQYSVDIREQTQVTDIGDQEILLSSSEKISYEKLIITTGAWATRLIDIPLEARKQELIYLSPKKKELFSPEEFPLFAHLDKGFYGFPIHGIDAVKIACHIPGDIENPDTASRDVSPTFIDNVYQFIETYIPQLSEAKILKTHSCFYSMTPDKDFIVDHIDKNIICAVGFSGHGFKFAPIIGQITAELAETGKTADDISRFRLSRF